MKKIIPLVIILGLFALSLWIRLPNMDRALGDHHEWVTQHTLIILKNWESQGALKHHFNLLMTFQGKINRGVYDYCGRLINKHGYGYYPSFPPGAVVYPYLIFKTLGLPVNPLNLQMFNVICHLLAAFILYWIIRKILSASYYSKEAIALIGVFFFLLLPNLLWFFSNVYSWDIFWCYPYIAGIALTLKLKELFENNKPHKFFLFLFGLNLFIMIYSDYYSLIFSVVVILFTIRMIPRNKTYIKLLTTTALFSFLPLLLTIIQYSSIDGIKSFLHCLLASKVNYQFRGLSDIEQIGIHAWIAYKLIFIPILIAIGYLFYQERKKIFKIFSPAECTALYLSFVPALLFLIIQARWSAIHDYSMLRLAPFLIIFLAILLSKIRLPLYWSGHLLLYMILWNILSASIFYYKTDFTHSRDVGFWKRQGKFVRANSEKEEIIFAIKDYGITDPRFTYYIRRNVQMVNSKLEAVAWLLAYQKPKGALFTIWDEMDATGPERIDLENINQILSKEKIADYKTQNAKFNKIAFTEFTKEDNQKDKYQFQNGSLISHTIYDPEGKKQEEYLIDYWTHKTTQFIFDKNEKIITQKDLVD